MRLMSRVALSELPPNTKKSSSTPTRDSHPKTTAKAAATTNSEAEPGARNTREPNTGSGNAFRSNFPALDNGNSSTTTTTSGTMYDGSTNPTAARAPTESTEPTEDATVTYPTRRLPPCTTTTAPETPGNAPNADSISPSSIRTPRIFT
ncbi:hypothetical protein BKP42_68430 [Rhodococcus erythropolis]|nr:hypothetical protein BKP42_68430 [Rhodococcus erythropolis]